MTRRVTFEQHPDEWETVGSGIALIFSGYINNASPQMTSLDIGFNHSWRSVQYLNERRGGLRGSLTNGSEEYSLYIGFWGYFTLHPAKSERHISFTYRAIFEDGIEEVGFMRIQANGKLYCDGIRVFGDDGFKRFIRFFSL